MTKTKANTIRDIKQRNKELLNTIALLESKNIELEKTQKVIYVKKEKKELSEIFCTTDLKDYKFSSLNATMSYVESHDIEVLKKVLISKDSAKITLSTFNTIVLNALREKF